jgi:hypothetical protein
MHECIAFIFNVAAKVGDFLKKNTGRWEVYSGQWAVGSGQQ